MTLTLSLAIATILVTLKEGLILKRMRDYKIK